MKKKLLAAVLMAGTMALSATAFTACSGGYSETFEGTVSAASYDTADKAAAGFVEKELSGSESRVELARYEKEKELSEAEIEKLNVGGEVDGAIKSVEKGKVYYKEVAVASNFSAVSAATQEAELFVTVYIIKYTATGTNVESYKYFAPLPENGEALSYSYYSSVLDAKKYENCTAKLTSVTTSSATKAGKTETATVSFEYVMKLNADKAYVQFKSSIPDKYGKVETVVMDMYLVDGAYGVKCAGTYEGQTTVISSSEAGLDVDSVSELYATQLTEAQCSLFVKTNYGFKLNEDTLKSLFAELGAPDAKFDGKCEYYVTEGRLSKEILNVSLDMNYEGYKTSTKVTTECKYSDFGTTTVVIPEEVKTLLGIN